MDKGTLIGRVTDAQGQPVVDAAAIIAGSSPSHKDIAALTNAEGEFTYYGLISGIYTIIINAEGYTPKSEQVRIETGRVERVTFRLAEGHSER